MDSGFLVLKLQNKMPDKNSPIKNNLTLEGPFDSFWIDAFFPPFRSPS
jgi:hypothetical protein